MTAELIRIPASRLERRVRRTEDREAWGRVIYLTGRGHLSLVAERPDITEQSLGEIHHIASRRLRQLGDTDGAA